MVKVDSLSLALGSSTILHQLSFSLREGSVTVLLGPNGSGKTTLLRVLSSYYRKYEGSVSIDGKELSKAKDEERTKLHAALSQEHPRARFTLKELMTFSNDKKKAEKAIEELGMMHLENKLLEEMSGGERALSYLTLLYSEDSLLYSLDEPDASLDSKARKLLSYVIRDLKERGKTILVSMHDLNRAMEIADDILVLKEGKLSFFGDKEAFLQSEVPAQVFGLEVKTLKDEEGKELKLFL